MAARPCLARYLRKIISVVFAQALNYAALEEGEGLGHNGS